MGRSVCASQGAFSACIFARGASCAWASSPEHCFRPISCPFCAVGVGEGRGKRYEAPGQPLGVAALAMVAGCNCTGGCGSLDTFIGA